LERRKIAARPDTGYGVVDVVVAAVGGALVAGLLFGVPVEVVGAVCGVVRGVMLGGTLDVLIVEVGVEVRCGGRVPVLAMLPAVSADAVAAVDSGEGTDRAITAVGAARSGRGRRDTRCPERRAR
jgi:hypothetical protein